MPKTIDLSAQRFGRLFVENEFKTINRKKSWKCLCDCGTVKWIPAAYLRHGNVKSCGCIRSEIIAEMGRKKIKPDGATKHPLYRRWVSMKQRCENPNTPFYKNYGGRGIKICNEWHDFWSFVRDMGLPPNPSDTIDRIDNDADYCPSNCAWRTRKDQLRNQRRTVFLKIDGMKITAKECSEIYALSYQALMRAYRKGGVSSAEHYVIQNRRCARPASAA